MANLTLLSLCVSPFFLCTSFYSCFTFQSFSQLCLSLQPMSPTPPSFCCCFLLPVAMVIDRWSDIGIHQVSKSFLLPTLTTKYPSPHSTLPLPACVKLFFFVKLLLLSSSALWFHSVTICMLLMRVAFTLCSFSISTSFKVTDLF